MSAVSPTDPTETPHPNEILAEERQAEVKSAVLGFVEVETSQGRALVEPWSMKQGEIIAGRLVAMTRKLTESGHGGEATVEDLIAICYREVAGIVALTIDWPEEKLEKLRMVEFLDLAKKVVEICIQLDSEDGGVMGKLAAFVGAWIGPAATGASLLGQSTPSAETATATATSSSDTQPD